MEDDEVVQTSDAEEIEALKALAPGYWSRSQSSLDIHGDLEYSPHLSQNHNEADGEMRLREDHVRTRYFAMMNAMEPPRKRLKLQHSSNAKIACISVPASPAAGLKKQTPLRFASAPSSPVAFRLTDPTELNSSLRSSQESNISNPVGGRGYLAISRIDHDLGTEVYPSSQLIEQNIMESSNPLQSTIGNSRMGLARSPSPDPLLLFTPRKARPVNSASSYPEERHASDLASPGYHHPDPGLSSPLTLISSPPSVRRAAPQQLPPRGLSASPRNGASLFQPVDEEYATMLAQEAAQGRYTLRARKDRQKNPYAYDKAVYKRLMRGNPDAIVKIISPPRPRRHRSKSRTEGESGSGDDVEDEYHAEEEDENDTATRRRKARWKNRSRSMSAGMLEHADGQASRRRRRSRSTASSGRDRDEENPASNVRPTSPHRRVHEDWYPAAFNESFSSSSSTDEGVTQSAAKHYEKSNNNSISIAVPPFGLSPLRATPSGHSTLRAGSNAIDIDLTADNASDHETSASIPRWRRRPSSMLSSVLLHSRSPSPDAIRSPILDPPAYTHDDDLIPDSGSPIPPPLSSTPIDFDAQFPAHVPGSPDQRRLDSPDSEVEVIPGRRLTLRKRSAVPSDGDSESQTSSEADAMTAKDRRRLKVLERMMPRIMIQRLQKVPALPSRRHSIGEDSESDIEDEPLRPGQSKIRIRAPSQTSKFDVRGDTESSDVDIHDMVEIASSSSSTDISESEMDVITIPSRQRTGAKHPHNMTDSDAEQGILRRPDDGEIRRYVSENVVSTRNSEATGEVKEGDLIDRMLSRTSYASGGTSRRRKPSKKNSRRSNPSYKNVHIVTAGARKTGSGRQTLLSFNRAPASVDHSTGVRPRVHDMHPVISDAVTEPRRRKKHKSSAGLFTFASGDTYLTSGRAHKQHVTMDTEKYADDSLSHSVMDIDPRAGPSTLSKHWRRKAGSTLESHWDISGKSQTLLVEDPPDHHPIHSLMFHRVKVDFDIPFLPSGISLGSDTYLGKGHLHELDALMNNHQPLCPNLCSYLDFLLQPTMSIQECMACLQRLSDKVHDLLIRKKEPAAGDHERWQTLLHSTNRHVSWLLHQAGEDDFVALLAAVQEHVSRLTATLNEPTEIIPEDEPPFLFKYEIRWFTVELNARIRCARRLKGSQGNDITMLHEFRPLICDLWNFGFEDLSQALVGDNVGESEKLFVPRRISELWICIIHIASNWALAMPAEISPSARKSSFWDVYLQTIHDAGFLGQNIPGVFASEKIWRSIFSLCALSQFSMHGITTSTPRVGPSWEVVGAALDRVQLIADPISDQSLSKRSLQKRDEYIRILISRCLILSHKWHWPLDDASSLFNRLLDIFKSRRFANLSHEPPDFPSFLRHNNLQLLSEHKRSDTGFALFLKLVVQAAKNDRTSQPEGFVSSKVKKLMSLCVPVGSVPFTRAAPPTGQELSMLYNRFSAVAVAIYLDPAMPNVKYRLANARRYVNFKDADDETQRACIRGLMHLTILMQHLRLPLDDLLDWLADLSNILIDEYQQAMTGGSGTSWTALSIQILLGSVRRIIETPLMDPKHDAAQYPDPALLSGPWVTRVLATSTNLTNIFGTRIEIRKLVQAFLNARNAVIPKSPRPRLPVVTAESQESQDDYADFDINFDDPELLAALGEHNESFILIENRKKDAVVSEIIDEHISPAIYRLVCKHFIEAGSQKSWEQYSQDADKWVDCWVGCANVLVQNGRRDWSLYLTLGPQSWERIIDPVWRRRVGLRFMLMLLQLDPSAYTTHKDQFVDVLVESVVTSKVTIEHEYLSLLFSIDGLRHPLLHDLPCQPQEGTADYHISRKDFLENRLTFVKKFLSNISDLLQREREGETALAMQNQTCIGSIVTMFSTMKDIYQQLSAGSEEHAKYSVFCQHVHDHLSELPILKSNPRLVSSVHWGTRFH